MKSKNFLHTMKICVYAAAGWGGDEQFLFLPEMTVNEKPSEGPFL